MYTIYSSFANHDFMNKRLRTVNNLRELVFSCRFAPKTKHMIISLKEFLVSMAKIKLALNKLPISSFQGQTKKSALRYIPYESVLPLQNLGLLGSGTNQCKFKTLGDPEKPFL